MRPGLRGVCVVSEPSGRLPGVRTRRARGLWTGRASPRQARGSAPREPVSFPKHVSLKLAAISSTRRLGLSCCEILTGQQAPLGSAPGTFSPQGARSCRWVTSTGDHQHLGGLAGVSLAEWLAAQAGRGGLRRKSLWPVLSEVGEGARRAAPWQPCWFAA